jgi:hypothetical protein
MSSTPKFIQGVFSFKGAGLDTPKPFSPRAVYQVPSYKRAQLIYVRLGNSSAELVTLLFTRDSRALRYFPVGAKSACHVSLAVTEDLFPESELELLLLAPDEVEGSIVVDLGLMEIE